MAAARTWPSQPGRPAVTVTVEDAGPGIPEADLERVFQPFQRLESSRNRGTGGVGLGLAIARQAIENEGGSVRLSNRPAGGLSAKVFLPCRMAARQGSPPRERMAKEQALRPDSSPGARHAKGSMGA